MPAPTAATSPARGHFPNWEQAELPSPPLWGWRHWSALIGPGLLMAGSNIGGGEWLFGPIVTAQYGGGIMWLASTSIILQVFYNLEVMRYALYTGEPILVGFFRTPPGPKFWTVAYLFLDVGAIWPYMASNAAVPLAAAFLGRLPAAEDAELVRRIGYAIFLASFLPLLFGGKIYNALERVMVTKIVLVLGYLGLIALFWTPAETWKEIFGGLLRFGYVPEGQVNWATLAAFAAIAGAGGLTNSYFSNFARDKGWGMGSQVGAIPSAVGGKTISLAHVGKIFTISRESLARWRGWRRHVVRDQLAVWAPGCILGVALPSMMSLQYLRGTSVDGISAAAMTARAMADHHGPIFWFLTLLCGFLVLAPSQISNIDGITRRWTDVIWVGSGRLRQLPGHQVKTVYYTIMTFYGLWGLLALRLTPNPLVLAMATAVLMNLALGFSALHTLYVNRTLLPPPLRPRWWIQLGLVLCSLYYLGISAVAFRQHWPRLARWIMG